MKQSGALGVSVVLGILCIVMVSATTQSEAGCPDDDGDGLCNSHDPCRHDPYNDIDADSHCGDADNCPNLYNFSQADTDEDDEGDACDPCPNIPFQATTDGDGDGKLDACDNCANLYNPSQMDIDEDGQGDGCDPCPTVPFQATTDGDGDGKFDVCDNCANLYNPSQMDTDGDAQGDGCDPCPTVPFQTSTDSDGDQRVDDCDNCPTMINTNQLDLDSDGEGDACDQWTMCSMYRVASANEVIVPDPDYESFLQPNRGFSYVDSAFGCVVKRVTDGVAQFDPDLALRHAYSSPSPFNSDNSLLLLIRAEPGNLKYIVTDLEGAVIRSEVDISVPEDAPPIWSASNPDLFYYVQGNEVRSYDVSLNTHDTLDAISAYPSIGILGDISPDGQHFVLRYLNRVHLYTVGMPGQAGSLGPYLRGGPLTDNPDNIDPNALRGCDVTPSENILCFFDTPLPRTINHYDGSTGEHLGVGGDPSAPVLTFTGHSDVARDPNGYDVLVVDNSAGNVSSAPAGCFPGVEKVRLSDGERVCVISWAQASPIGGAWYGKSIHISVNNGGSHPWVLISTSDAVNPNVPRSGDTRNWSLDPDWAALWGAYYNELLLVRLDGSQVHRLAHHRSRDGGDLSGPNYSGYGYWSLPRAALSRDARYVLFDSNYAQLPPNVKNPTDVYLIKTTIEPPASCGPCVGEYCEAGSKCTFNGTCGANGCCWYECVSDSTCVDPDPVPPNTCSQ